MYSCHDIKFGSVEEILTVSSIKEVPEVDTLPESLHVPPPAFNTPTSENKREIRTSTSSEAKKKITTPTSSEVKFAFPNSPDAEVKCTTLISSETGLKFTAPISSETKANCTSSTVPPPAVHTPTLENNGQYDSKDIRCEKPEIKSKHQPTSPLRVVKKKVKNVCLHVLVLPLSKDNCGVEHVNGAPKINPDVGKIISRAEHRYLKICQPQSSQSFCNACCDVELLPHKNSGQLCSEKSVIPGLVFDTKKTKLIDNNLITFSNSFPTIIQYGDTSLISVHTDDPRWSPGGCLNLSHYVGRFLMKKESLKTQKVFKLITSISK